MLRRWMSAAGVPAAVMFFAVVSFGWLPAAEEPAAASAEPPRVELREPSPAVARMQNLTDQAFRYRLGRRQGVTWSDAFVLEPGETHEFLSARSGQVYEYEGLGCHPPYIRVQFTQRERVFRTRVTERNELPEGRTAEWYVISDRVGLVQLVQAETLEEARGEQDRLRKRPAFTVAEINQLRISLEANRALLPGNSRPELWRDLLESAPDAK